MMMGKRKVTGIPLFPLVLILMWSIGAVHPGGFAKDRLFSRGRREGNSFSVQVTAKENPIASAEVFIGIHRAGWTDGRGIYDHYYTTRPVQSLTLSVRKPGFREWRRRVRIRPGRAIQVHLEPDFPHRLTLTVLTEKFGVLSGMGGLEVFVNGARRGFTDGNGEFHYSQEYPGPLEVEIRHPQDLAPSWKANLSLQGSVRMRRFFYPAEPEIVRLGIAPFQVNGFRDGSLQKALEKFGESLEEEIHRSVSFHVLTHQEISGLLREFGMDWERLEKEGWEDTDLRWDLDLILIGSMTRTDDFVVEMEARLPEGEELFRILGRVGGPDGMSACGKKLARAVRELFPFRGSILEVSDRDLKVHLGTGLGWDPMPGTVLFLHAFEYDDSGRRIGEERIGTARLRRVGRDVSWAEVERLAPGKRVSSGDLAIRYVEPPMGEDAHVPIALLVRSGPGSTGVPLEGVNVYLNDRWAGRTDREGRTEVFLREGEPYRMNFYLHGYGPVERWIPGAGEGREIVVFLPRYFSLLRIHSEPPGAEVWLDGKFIGRTPIEDGVMVTLGQHEIRLEAGGEYRPIIQKVLFSRPKEDFTGDRMMVLERAFTRMGRDR